MNRPFSFLIYVPKLVLSTYFVKRRCNAQSTIEFRIRMDLFQSGYGLSQRTISANSTIDILCISNWNRSCKETRCIRWSSQNISNFVPQVTFGMEQFQSVITFWVGVINSSSNGSCNKREVNMFCRSRYRRESYITIIQISRTFLIFPLLGIIA